MTLTEFLLARIAEDEAVARATPAGTGGSSLTVVNGVAVRYEGPMNWYAGEDGEDGWAIDVGFTEEDAAHCVTCNDSGGNELGKDDVAHMVRWHPARVLAECEAKRRIVRRLAHLTEDGAYPDLSRRERSQADATLCDLAAPYANHQDYRQEWRP